jgi:hypothetical protein
MRDLLTWSVTLIFYGFGLGVLQVPNPKRVIAAKAFFVFGALWGIGVTSMWAVSTSRGWLFRLIFEFALFGLIGAGTVELFRFANYTEPIPEPPISAPAGASVPERADIFTTLTIDSVKQGKVKYHVEIKNGQVPVTITSITSRTEHFFQHEEGPYIPKNLRPGENLSITGDVMGVALPADKSTNLAVRIGYDAEIKGVRKGFVSGYRFFIDHPPSPRTLLPFSVSHDSEEQSVDQARAEAANRFALPEATVFLVLPEKKLEDGTPNIITVGNAERRFIFNPEIREVQFESRAQSGRLMRVRLPLPQTNHPQGLHSIILLWSRTHALLEVDGIEVQVRDQKPKAGNPRGLKAVAERKTERPNGLTPIAFMALLRIHPIAERRRKYIHDLGRVGRGRFSVYLNEDNRLAFELSDAEGQTYSLEGPPDLPSDFFRLDVQIDRTQQWTRLQMWINQSEADSKEMMFPISLGFDTVEGATLGADLNGENCARIDVAELRMAGQSLLTAQSDMHPTKYVEFNGKQWFRNLGPGVGMRQDIKSAQPVFRSLQ